MEFFYKHWGDLASVFGVVVSFVGFWYAIWVARQAKSAAEQARRCLENLQAVCAAAGTSLERAVRLTVYMTDLGEFAPVNEVYGSFFTGEEPPALPQEVVEELAKRVQTTFGVDASAFAHSATLARYAPMPRSSCSSRRARRRAPIGASGSCGTAARRLYTAMSCRT